MVRVLASMNVGIPSTGGPWRFLSRINAPRVSLLGKRTTLLWSRRRVWSESFSSGLPPIKPSFEGASGEADCDRLSWERPTVVTFRSLAKPRMACDTSEMRSKM